MKTLLALLLVVAIGLGAWEVVALHQEINDRRPVRAPLTTTTTTPYQIQTLQRDVNYLSEEVACLRALANSPSPFGARTGC